MASLSLRGLSKTYDRRAAALRELSLEVEDGELVALLGPSGCGKSTILRLIAGLETPTTGTVWIGGREVTRLPPADRNVAMVFQSYALYPHFTVRGNLEFPLRMRGVNPADRITRVERVAAQLGLGDLLHRLPAQLSGGQRQRVALGRALVRNPDVFLLDEPLSNLDAALRAQLRAELLALHRSLGATMLYVTHDQVEALTLGHRLVLLKDGAIQQVGTPREVYDRPATTFVAQFVGTPGMNLVGLENGEAPVHRVFLGGGAPPAGAARVGIRPEHLRLEKGAEAQVTLVERLGSETLVHVLVNGSTLTVRVPGLAELEPGSRVGLAAAPEHCHWFDPEGRRIG